MKRLLSGLLAVLLLIGTYGGLPIRARAETMTSSDAFIEILKQREGFSKYPYEDNSQWSIGYGTRVPSGKLDYYKEHGITEEEAVALMRSMLKGFENSVLKFAAKYNFTLTQNQFDALVSFSYNCGDAWTTNSSGYMNRAVREGWTGSDFLYAILLWSTSAGQYILINRRLYEANMYINGIYQKDYDKENGNFKYVFLEAGAGKTRYIIHGYDKTDPKGVRAEFSVIPSGVDGNGKAFDYQFEGWYTAPTGGEKVIALDGTLANGAVLYARWMDPSGNVVYLPKGAACEPTSVIATGTVNIRTGPGTFYSKNGKVQKGTAITLTRVYIDGTKRWGEFEGGWVSLDYTNYDAVVGAQDVWPKSGTVNANGVNVRTGPGTGYDSVTKLSEGTRINIHEKVYDGSKYYWGRMDDGSWIALQYVTFDVTGTTPEPDTPEDETQDTEQDADTGTDDPIKTADINGNGSIDKDDAIYLLRHVVYPAKYPVLVNADINGSGAVDQDDAIYLLRHVVYPDKYPLKLGD
ncbi:MAG: hypothetical protein IKJ94_06485 [Oscillospiraceae bacterium]|nr:hypothetical protein [Oscillospiraceae bacterium]